MRRPLDPTTARLRGLLLALTFSACGGEPSTVIILAPGGADFVLTAERLEAGGLRNLEIADLSIERAEIELDSNPDLAVAFFSRAQVATLVEGARFDLPLEAQSPPNDTDVRTPTLSQRGTHLPPETEFFEVTADLGELVPSDQVRRLLMETVGLLVPYDPEHCRPTGAQVLSPFGDPQVGERVVHELIILDQDLLVARETYSVLARGRAPGPPHVLKVDELFPRPTPMGNDPVVNAIAVHRGPDQITLYAAGGLSQPNDELGQRQPDIGPGWWAITTVDASGFGPVVYSATVSPSAMRRVAVRSDQVAMVDDEGRTFVFEHPGRTPLHTADIPNVRPDERIERLEATPFAETPFVASVRGKAMRYRPNGAWVEDPVDVAFAPGLQPSAIQMIAGRDGRPELWIGFRRGLLARRLDNEPWEDLKLVLPPRLTCLKTAGLNDDIVDMVVDATHAHLLIEDCPALLHVRRSDLCTSTSPLMEGEFGNIATGPSALDLSNERVVAYDRQSSRFHELDLRP